MLEKLFISMLNMSLIGSYAIVFVLIVRLLLKKAPKIFSYALWGIVLFRLLCPFSFESAFSLIPMGNIKIPQDIIYSTAPQINTGIGVIDNSINPILPAPNIGDSVNPIQIWIFIGAIIWVLGMLAMLIYSIIAFTKLKRSLIGAVRLKENIYIADHISSPFVMGLIKPKIYLPSSLSDREKDFIIAHEICHVMRFDHVTRILGFAALAAHWFNPLVWTAFIVSGKDMELSCDEAVMKKMNMDICIEYSQSLLRFGTVKRMIHATPLAFGEGDTKNRVKNVLNYKKPAFWVVSVSVIAVIIAGVGLAANPKEKLIGEPHGFSGVNATVLKIDAEGQTMVVEGIDQNSVIGHQCILDWSNANLQTVEADGSLKTLSINDFTPGDYVVLFIDEIQETYPTKAKASTVQLQGEALLKDIRPMIIVDGILYLDTGKEVHGKIESSAVLGKIHSASLAGKKPTENGQCNFNNGVGAKYAVYEDGMAVFLNNKWYFFEKEKDNEIAAEYYIFKHDKNGEVLAESMAETQELASQIIFDCLVKSSAWDGVDISTVEEYYCIRQSFLKTDEVHDYYAYRRNDGTAVLQSGTNGKYTVLSDNLYEELEKQAFFPNTDDVSPTKNTNYIQSLTPEELQQTEEVVRAYFIDEAPYYEGVVSIEPMPDDFILYQNSGIEGEYEAGNIIIYNVMTERDEKDGNPKRSASVARASKDAAWELINQGY